MPANDPSDVPNLRSDGVSAARFRTVGVMQQTIRTISGNTIMITSDLSNWTTLALVDKLIAVNDELIARGLPGRDIAADLGVDKSRTCARSRLRTTAPECSCRRLTTTRPAILAWVAGRSGGEWPV